MFWRKEKSKKRGFQERRGLKKDNPGKKGYSPPDKIKGTVPLTCLKGGQEGIIISILVEDINEISRLKAMGLLPGAWVKVERVFPVMALTLKFSRLFLDESLAELILILPLIDKKCQS